VKAAKAKVGQRKYKKRFAVSVRARKALTPVRRALATLALDPAFVPETSLHAIVKQVKLPYPVYTYLRHSGAEVARKVMREYGKLAPVERKAVTVDHLIAAAGVDFHAVFGALSEQVSKLHSGVAEMLAAVASPDMVRAAKRFGNLLPDNNADRKMILQATKVVPVPKNQVTNVDARGMMVDARTQHATIHVPSLEEVVREVDVEHEGEIVESKPAELGEGEIEGEISDAVTE
jgi:hypothetical protein